MLILPIYNQLDPRWCNLPLGTTGNTIGSHGCTVTDLAMALARYGIQETPASVVMKLNQVNGFLPSGDLIWASIPKAWPKMHFIWRQYTTLEEPHYANKKTMASAIVQIHRLISLGQPVLINVDAILPSGRPDHWVVAFDGSATDFLINDPNGGRKEMFSTRYGELARGIYGYTVLVGDTAFLPLWSTEEEDAHALWKAAEVAAGRNVQVYSREIIQDLIN